MSFTEGIFTPDAQPVGKVTMLARQAKFEATLLLRNGEQFLLTLLIPIFLLVGLTVFKVGTFDRPRIETFVPSILSIAVLSTGFTGQAIAVAFDRRYGALKRLGATALPRWGIVGGKCIAVVIAVIFQSSVLGGIGLLLGWRPDVWGVVAIAFILALGTITFTSFGLLLGGTLKSEIVLALANLLWFFFIAASAGVTFNTSSNSTASHWLRLIPSGELTSAVIKASYGIIDVSSLVRLLLWGIVGTVLARKFFKYQ